MVSRISPQRAFQSCKIPSRRLRKQLIPKALSYPTSSVRVLYGFPHKTPSLRGPKRVQGLLAPLHTLFCPKSGQSQAHFLCDHSFCRRGCQTRFTSVASASWRYSNVGNMKIATSHRFGDAARDDGKLARHCEQSEAIFMFPLLRLSPVRSPRQRPRRIARSSPGPWPETEAFGYGQANVFDASSAGGMEALQCREPAAVDVERLAGDKVRRA